MARSGVVQTIEAVLAGTILLIFVVSVMPRLSPAADTSPPIEQQTRQALSTLDQTGRLRPAAFNMDITGIKSDIEDALAPRQVAVSLRWINATAGTATPTGTDLYNISINTSTIDSVTARVWIQNAVDPDISFSDTNVFESTGTVRDRYVTKTINSGFTDGNNRLNITVSSASTVEYSIEAVNTLITRTPPREEDIHAASYILSGTNTTFQPMEVTALTWQ